MPYLHPVGLSDLSITLHLRRDSILPAGGGGEGGKEREGRGERGKREGREGGREREKGGREREGRERERISIIVKQVASHAVHVVLVRSGPMELKKERRKKQASSNKQGKATQHTHGSHFF